MIRHKISQSLLLMFALCFILTCCSDNKEVVSESIRVNKETFSFPKAGATETLYVQASGALTITMGQEWIKVSEDASTSDKTKKYAIEIGANPDTDERIGSITLHSGSLSQEVRIVQAAATHFLVKNTQFAVSSDGDILTVEMTTSGEYAFKIDQEGWIHSVASKAVTERVEQFRIDSNPMYEGRSGTITFTMADLSETVTVSQTGLAEVPQPDKTGMESDATQLAKKIFAGWNLGNSLEVPGSEVMWGNPRTTKAMIDGVKAAGFNAVRIPCAWDSYLENADTYTIKGSWLARVKEVVNYCVDNDMYAIINIHWDGGWLEEHCTADKQESVNVKQHALWTQIASYFRDFDEHLIFAGCNEPNVDNAAQMAVLKSYEQTFINAVRATGGKNVYRNLIVQGPATDVDKTFELMDLPVDETPNRMMMEVHYYSPWLFCILEKDGDSVWEKMQYFWGDDYAKYATGEYANRWTADYNEAYVDQQFEKMKTLFVDRNIPVILGEYSAVARVLNDPVMQQVHDESRAYFMNYVTRQAKNYGLIPFYWDNGIGNMSLFDRNNDMAADQQLLQAIMDGAGAGSYPF